MSKKTIIVIIILLAIILAMGIAVGVAVCRQSDEDSSSTPPPDIVENTPEPTSGIIEVESITIQLESDVIVRGERFWPEVIIQPANATDKFFEIHSDNEMVLRQRGNHWIAVEAGTANIIATTMNGVTATIEVTIVAPDLESIEFIDSDITMILDDVVQLMPIFSPENPFLEEPIRYTSDRSSVATVSEDGKITAVGPGTATIKGTVGEISAEIKVTVIIPVRSINVIMNRRVYSIGDQAEFKIELTPANATNADVTVSFSGAPVTSTGDNTFICESAGEVKITFTAQNGSTVELTIHVYNLAVLTEEVHRLTNIERGNAGLSNLGRNQPLTQTALVRARETITYFSHTRPDGREFFTAFAENNVQYRFAGENLAAGQTTPAEVVRSWMDSPGHRENIVNGEFNNMGVGVVMDNDGRIYWTQTFTD